MGYPYIYISPGFGQSKKNVLKYAAAYHESRPATRSRKTVATLEGIIKPGYISTFMNSREVHLPKLVQVRFVSAIAGWS